MSAEQVCRIKAPSRLHLGFIDMHGGLGRRFGSVGVTLVSPCLELSLRPAAALEVTGKSTDEGCARVRAAAEHFLQAHQDIGAARIEVHAAIPEHQGFGSGTQTALAVAHGLARLSKVQLASREIMRAAGRGRRSGVGVAAFEFGGLVVDGGKGSSEAPPPLLARFALPQAWRVMLITDNSADGVHGAAETGAFDQLPTFSSSCAGYLSRVVLMELLPGAKEGDFSAFADATTRLQDCIGDYFAAVQKGRYASVKVGRVLEHLRTCGVKGIGQSSWGPTGFAFAADEEHARQLLEMAAQASPDGASLGLEIVRMANAGAEIS